MNHEKFLEVYSNGFMPICTELDKEAIIHYWMNINKCSSLGDFWLAALKAYFKYVGNSGWVVYGQLIPEITCIRNDPLEDQINEVKMWIPHMKGNPKKMLIYWSGCNFSHWSLYIYDNSFELENYIVNSNIKIKKTFSTLEDSMKYIQERLYFK